MDGAADTAPVRALRPGGRPRYLPPVPRIAALGLRVGGSVCRALLATGTRSRCSGITLAE